MSSSSTAHTQHSAAAGHHQTPPAHRPSEDPARDDHPSHHVAPVAEYLVVFAALMVLLGATIGAAYIKMGAVTGLVVAYLIASVKAALIIMYFMHVKYSSRLTWVFATASFLWLGILLVMTMGDFLTRDPKVSEVQRADPMTHIRTTDSADPATWRTQDDEKQSDNKRPSGVSGAN